MNSVTRTVSHFFLAMALIGLPPAVFAEPAAKAGPAPKALVFGSVAAEIPAEMHRRLRPLAHYLSTALKRPVTLRLAANMPEAIAQVASGEVDLAYLTPVAYLRAHDEGQVRLVVKTVTQGRGAFRLMIAVRDDSPLRHVGDLAGRRFAFGDKAAVLQRAVVVGAGMPLERLGSYEFLGYYDNIARGIVNGNVDAGILRDTTAFEWEKKGLRILYRSPELPPYNVVASRHVDDRLLQAAQQAFLRLDEKNPGHRPVIHALATEYDGFARTSDAEYDVIRRLIRGVK